MRRILLSTIKILISLALLYLALRKVNLTELASRINNVASLGWIVMAIAVTFLQIYVGVQGWATKLPTDPTGEFDLYGGIRPTFGPLALDFGFMYYWYPNETQLFAADPAFTARTQRGRGSERREPRS